MAAKKPAKKTAKASAPLSGKVQALLHAGLITAANAKNLPKDLADRIESLSDAEITHLIATKHKLGKHPHAAKPMMFL